MSELLKQRWRWCLWCHRLFRDFPPKFCPFDNWYLTDSQPSFVAIRVRNAETGRVIRVIEP